MAVFCEQGGLLGGVEDVGGDGGGRGRVGHGGGVCV